MMLKPTFCTYFDHNYLSRGLTLYETLKAHCPDAVLHVLALSPECERVLRNLALPDLTVTPLSTLEHHDAALLAVKNTRTLVEYYFTLSPCWPLYLFDTLPELDLLTYVDADCAIFGDPSGALAEMKDLSIGMVGHRFPEPMREKEKWGRYNVGWLSFKRDMDGLACLRWWRDRCLEWCEDRLDGARFADQKYLDQWPALFLGARELRHRGVNVAPWNVERFALTCRNQSLLVDGDPLVCYHFHACKRVLWRFWDAGLATYEATLTPFLQSLYGIYLGKLMYWERRIAPLMYNIKYNVLRDKKIHQDLMGTLRLCKHLIRLWHRRSLLWQ